MLGFQGAATKDAHLLERSAVQHCWATAMSCLTSMHSHSYAFVAFCSYSLGICMSWKVLGFRLLPWNCFCTGLLVLGIFAKNIVPGFLCIAFFIYFKTLLNDILLEWLIVTWLVNRTYWDTFKILSVPIVCPMYFWGGRETGKEILFCTW